MTEPWALREAARLWYAKDSLHTHATVHGRIEGLALALAAARRKGIEETARLAERRKATYDLRSDRRVFAKAVRALADREPT